MANLLKREGDFTYWDDGAVRYAKGNSLGKTPGSLAERNKEYLSKAHQALAAQVSKRHPKLAEALSKSTNGNNGKEWGQAVKLVKADRQIERKLEAQRAAELAMMQAAASSSPGNPKVPTEAWGLLAGNLTERALMDENTGHAVSAVGMIGRMTGYLGEESARAPQQAIQVNVTIEAGALDQAQILEARWSERYEPPQLAAPDPDPPDVRED